MRNRDYTFTNTVWLIEEEVFGVLAAPMGAYISMVAYSKGGIDFEVLMDNEDFMTMEEMFFDNDDN